MKFLLPDVLLVLAGFIKTEPAFCMKHFFSCHILHHLGRYINSVYVRDFYTALFDPNDFTLNIPKAVRENLYKYAYNTGFFVNMTTFMLHPREGLDTSKYTREYKYE